MGKTTADTARSRLFGSPPATRPEPTPDSRATVQTPPRDQSKPKGGGTSKPRPAVPSVPAGAEVPVATGGTNYLGSGRYLYKGREARKMSVYVSPELVPALKAAGASGKDPRGNDMSEIVETLIREAGYGDE